ncbi:hypothetical protein Dimus_000334 [Dionaea muscipula]
MFSIQSNQVSMATIKKLSQFSHSNSLKNTKKQQTETPSYSSILPSSNISIIPQSSYGAILPYDCRLFSDPASNILSCHRILKDPEIPLPPNFIDHLCKHPSSSHCHACLPFSNLHNPLSHQILARSSP